MRVLKSKLGNREYRHQRQTVVETDRQNRGATKGMNQESPLCSLPSHLSGLQHPRENTNDLILPQKEIKRFYTEELQLL